MKNRLFSVAGFTGGLASAVGSIVLFVSLVSVQPASADDAPVLLKAFNRDSGSTEILGVMVSMPVCQDIARVLTKVAALPPVDPIVFFCTRSSES